MLEGSEGGVDRANTTGIAVDEAWSPGSELGPEASGDVYLDNGTSISAFNSSGARLQTFGGSVLQSGQGIAINGVSGNVYVVDAAEQKIDVFQPEDPTAPRIEGLSAQDAAAESVVLHALVNPAGADTHVYFQYGTANCATEPTECTDAPVPPGFDIGGADDGEGFGTRNVEVTLHGLKPNTSYHFAVLAGNGIGLPARSEDRFATLAAPPSAAAAAGRRQGMGNGFACRKGRLWDRCDRRTGSWWTDAGGHQRQRDYLRGKRPDQTPSRRQPRS